jgi:hypothetical protein
VPGDAGSSRRVVDDARRVLDRPVEAHRARPAGQEPSSSSSESSRSSGEPRLVRREVEARPAREASPTREEPRQIERAREEPRQVERAREQPRQVERTREQPRQVERTREEPRRVERSAPAPDRETGRAEGRSSGGGSRPADGGRRRR